MSREDLSAGRDAFAAQRWRDAFALLSKADDTGPLDAEDLCQLAAAAYLTGREVEWGEAWSRAHQQFRDRGDAARSARCAFWLAFGFMNSGEMARSGGWLARAERLLDDGQLECAERGYLLLPGAIEACDNDPNASYAAFLVADEIGARFGDADLVALARHGQGRALVRLAQPAKGMALLDEVMVAVTAGELSPIVVGDVYCGLIEACHETFDIRRAQEWTAALSRWCDSQPGLVPYRGQCLVYRAAVTQMQGAWADALDEAVQACQHLSEPKIHPAVGAAYYQRAELHRLRGEFPAAEEAYREADRHGHAAQPGLAQLRLVEGQVDVASATIRRVFDETQDRLTRSRVLSAYVEIMLAAGDVTAARAGADELSNIADSSEAPFLQGASAHATGATLLAEGDLHRALAALREAHAYWRSIDAPHEAARTRVLIGIVCGGLGDVDGADLELRAAREAFERLGAAPELLRLDKLDGRSSTGGDGGLTARELHILRLVATGKTNRAIAEELVLSEKTVARHLSNIFTKIGVASRAAATAYAYEHGLVQQRA